MSRQISTCSDKSRYVQTYVPQHTQSSLLYMSSSWGLKYFTWRSNFSQLLPGDDEHGDEGDHEEGKMKDGNADFKFLPVFVSWALRWCWADQIELWTGPGAGRCLSPETCLWLFVLFNFLQLEMYHFVVCKVGLLAQSGNVIHDECLDLVMGLLTTRYQRGWLKLLKWGVMLNWHFKYHVTPFNEKWEKTSRILQSAVKESLGRWRLFAQAEIAPWAKEDW